MRTLIKTIEQPEVDRKLVHKNKTPTVFWS